MFNHAKSIFPRLRKKAAVLTLVAGTAIAASTVPATAMAVNIKELVMDAEFLARGLRGAINQLRNNAGNADVGRLWQATETFADVRNLTDQIIQANRQGQRLRHLPDVGQVAVAVRNINAYLAEAINRDAAHITRRASRDFPRNEGPFHLFQGTALHAGANAIAFTGASVAAGVAIVNVVQAKTPASATQAFASSALAVGAGYKFLADFMAKAQDTLDFFKRKKAAHRKAEADLRRIGDLVAYVALLNREAAILIRSTQRFFRNQDAPSAVTVIQNHLDAINETWRRVLNARRNAERAARAYLNEERQNDNGR